MTRLPTPSRLIGPAITCALLASPAFADFTGVSTVQNDARNAAARTALMDAGVPGAETAVVYRVYATFDAPGIGLINTARFTTFVHIQTSTGVTFYQDPVGNALPPNEGVFPFFPTLQFDSYGTIGAQTLGDGGNILNEPLTEENPSSYIGGWFTGTTLDEQQVGAAAAQADLDGDFGTLLFQFTVIGSDENTALPFTGNLSIFVLDLDNSTLVTEFHIDQLTPPCPGELVNGKHDIPIVNGADLAALLSQWGPSTDTHGNIIKPADFNFDGQVDGADLATLLANWGCSP